MAWSWKELPSCENTVFCSTRGCIKKVPSWKQTRAFLWYSLARHLDLGLSSIRIWGSGCWSGLRWSRRLLSEVWARNYFNPILVTNSEVWICFTPCLFLLSSMVTLKTSNLEATRGSRSNLDIQQRSVPRELLLLDLSWSPLRKHQRHLSCLVGPAELDWWPL